VSLSVYDRAAILLADTEASMTERIEVAKLLRLTQGSPCPGVQCKPAHVDMDEEPCPLCGVLASYEHCKTCEGNGWVDDPSDGGTMCCTDCEDGRVF